MKANDNGTVTVEPGEVVRMGSFSAANRGSSKTYLLNEIKFYPVSWAGYEEYKIELTDIVPGQPVAIKAPTKPSGLVAEVHNPTTIDPDAAMAAVRSLCG